MWPKWLKLASLAQKAWNRNLVALLLLSYRCFVAINVLWLFLTVPWVGLQCVIMVFSDHTHLLLLFVYSTFQLFYIVFASKG